MDTYEVIFHPDYAPEFRALGNEVKEALGEVFDLLRETGPELGRPNVDTLHGSKHANMKEIRVLNTWRVAFAFDPERRAIVVCGGDKSGVNQARFYRELIRKADSRYDQWLSGDDAADR